MGVRISLVAVACIAAAALGAVACAGDNDDGRENREAREQVDERSGRFRNVAIGDRASEARQRLGRPRPYDEQGRVPGGESTIPYLAADKGGLSYDGVFYATLDERVSAIIVYGDGAATSADVQIGDPLDDAEKAYPAAECADEEFGDPSRSAYCELELARCLWLWIGGDPVDNIVLSIVPPSGSRGRCARARQGP